MGSGFEELHTLALRRELQASTRRLYGARSNVPKNLKPYQVRLDRGHIGGFKRRFVIQVIDVRRYREKDVAGKDGLQFDPRVRERVALVNRSNAF